MELVVNRVKFKWVDGQEYEFNVQCLVSARTLKKDEFCYLSAMESAIEPPPKKVTKGAKGKGAKGQGKGGKGM